MATDRATLEQWIRQIGELAESKPDPSDAWECVVDGANLIFICHELDDRMRVMLLIGDARTANMATFGKMLEANFDRALDAKYTISHGQIWAVFMHPLSSLEHKLFFDGVRQVVSLGQNFGSTFAGGDIRFDER
jgi:hypothetical protein